MAGSSEDGRRRGHEEEAEEGELVPGRCDSSDMDTEDYYNRDCYLSSDDTDEITSDSRARSDVTVPANSNASPSSSSSAAAAAGNSSGNGSSSPVACPICGKEFRSSKAACGHMKVHQQQQQHGAIEQQGTGTGTGAGKKDSKGIKRNVVAVAGGWGGTGKRGGSGCCSKQQPASPDAQSSSDQSMASIAIVVAEAEPKIVLQPMPLAFAAPNPLPTVLLLPPMASAAPSRPSSVPIASTMHSDAMVANPPAEAVVHLHAAAAHAHAPPPPAGSLHVVHATSSSVHQQPIEPPTKPADAEEQRVHHPPVPIIAPPPVAASVSASAGRQNPNGYTCKQCGEWFAKHQGLGGHMAAHKTRELAAAPCRPDAKPVTNEHVCKICGAVFLAGVQLGGHMRKHFSGVIVPKKKPRRLVDQPPPPRPTVPGRVLLFGVDIGAPVQPPAPQQQRESSSATEAEAPSSSTRREL